MGSLAIRVEDKFTYGDYLKWDDNKRWELIDGIAHTMTPTPRPIHQLVLGELHYQLKSFFRGKKCQVFIAPFDVRLPESDESDELINTVVQPDISVVCDRNKVDEAGCKGAPDLIIEILSPSTAGKDQKIKLIKYEQSGVREYWIVDPINRTVYVYLLGEKAVYERPAVYLEADSPEVKIFPGLVIDLESVFDEYA